MVNKNKTSNKAPEKKEKQKSWIIEKWNLFTEWFTK